MEAVETKRCSRCGLSKEISAFGLHRGTLDGFQYYCKTCRTEIDHERYEKNRDLILARQTLYRTENRERRLQTKRENYRRHKAQWIAWKREWRKANPEKAANEWQTRRARLKNAPVNDLTFEQWLELLEQFGFVCAYCQSTSKLTMDHIVPLSRGGSHTKSNIVPACQPCNSRKGSKSSYIRAN